MDHFPLAPEDGGYLSLHGIPLRRELLTIKTIDSRTPTEVCLSLGLSFPSEK